MANSSWATLVARLEGQCQEVVFESTTGGGRRKGEIPSISGD